MELFTVGVYGKTEQVFFDQLVTAQVQQFVDIRRRRGLRGGLYRFANSRMLQAELARRQIRYLHQIDLSPTERVRQIQNEADRSSDFTKRSREELSPEFISAYQSQLDEFDFSPFLTTLSKFRRNVLFCVEARPTACHRSILASELQRRLPLTVIHL